jgi:integrase
MSTRIPTYRLHRQSGQAIVTLSDGHGNRRDVLLGKFGSAESRAEYARVIGEWEASGRRARPPATANSLSVAELCLSYLDHAATHYRDANGAPTSELTEIRLSIRHVRTVYGHTRAAEFGPLALKSVRAKMVESGLSRGVVNQRIGRIKRAFKWAVSEQLVVPTVLTALQAVVGLQAGRTTAREPEPVKPVPEGDVDAVIPFLTRQVKGMVQLQRLTGMRPGEVVRMTAAEIDMTGPVWVYRPERHKTAWRGKERAVALGPRAQAIIREFLGSDASLPLFSPRHAVAEWRAKTIRPLTSRRKRRHRSRATSQYSVITYQKAIERACIRASIPHWSPNQLRHLHATMVRKQFGLEAAQVALGHAHASITEVYAERDLSLATKIAAEVG